MNAQPTKFQYTTLDGLRGIAAVLIIERHTRQWFEGLTFYSSYFAVDFFFLLSGFVLAHAYDDRLRNGMSAVSFMRSRAIRLYPLYMIALMLTIIIEFYNKGTISPITVLCALLFLPNYFGTTHGNWFVGASWSLSFELLVNSVFAAIHRELSNKVLIVIILLSFALCSYCVFTFGSLDIGYKHPHMIGGFARVFFSFFLGVLLYRNQFNKIIITKYLSWPCVIWFVLVLAIPNTKSFRPWIEITMISVVLPFLLVVASQTNPSRITKKIFYPLGIVSYGVYIMHSSLSSAIDILARDLFNIKLIDFTPWGGLIAIITMVIIVYILDKFYDAPIRKVLNLYNRRL